MSDSDIFLASSANILPGGRGAIIIYARCSFKGSTEMRYHLKVEGEQNPFVRALIKYTCHTSDKFANYLVLANMTIFLKGGLFLTNV